ncbi:MAG: ABC transporter ATP-binding protein/permease [Oscillospiraceae bacterium]|jgi:ATP-binding cassette subfamily B protein|nr:ABC transporter ATP-binding protein/permease [Oscillospiraceae bacterium]
MLKLLRRFTPEQWLMALISTVLVATQVWLDLRLPDYMTEITELLQIPGSTTADIWRAGGKMLLCALGSLAASIVVGFLAARVAAGFSQKLRFSIFDRVLSFSMGEINGFSTSSLITRSTNDVTQVQMLIALGLQIIIKAPIMAVWAIFKIAGKGTEWTMATGLMILFMLAVIITISALVMPRFKRIQSLTDALNRVTRENLTGLRVVRAYNAEDFQLRKFEAVNSDLTGTYLFTTRMMAAIMPCMVIVMNGLTLSVYWIGASLINAAGLAEKVVLFSNMVVFSQYAMQVVIAFMMLTMIFIMLPRVTVSAKRINEVLDTESAVRDGPGALPGAGVPTGEEVLDTEGAVRDGPDALSGAGAPTGEVEFRGVSFKYPGAEDYVIRNVSFRANKGETVAFIGSTGSGKSTIINLIPRFYDATEGQVLIDGVDVREYTQKQLRDKLGYIPQRAVLFTGTVASNVAYGDNGRGDKSEEAVEKAVAIAQGAEFVLQMPEAYGSPIAQGGTNVSGGQKQRLCIARAVCREPEIFIFDDSFSALDFKTDKGLRAALKKELSGITSIIVAQRIGTIRDADRIVVLENGEVVGIGTHGELMDGCGVYREIALSQLSEEELANG